MRSIRNRLSVTPAIRVIWILLLLLLDSYLAHAQFVFPPVTGGGGGGGSLAIQQNGVAVGTRATLNVIDGTGSANTIIDTGTVINLQTAPDTAVMTTNASLQSGSHLNLTETSSSGTTYTFTMNPTLIAYTTNMEVHLILTTLCTAGAVTINIDTLGAKPLKENDGTTNPVAADCPASKPLTLKYDGTVWRIGGTGGGSTLYQSAQQNTGTVAMTGSNVAVYTFSSVPPLAPGACYIFDGIVTASASYTAAVYVDSTSVAILESGTTGGYYRFFRIKYCNNPGSQTAQTMTFMPSTGYNPTFVSGSGYTAHFGTTPQQTPTGVNWTSSHTVYLYVNSASGNATGIDMSINY